MSKKMIVIIGGIILALVVFIIVLFLENSSKQTPVQLVPSPTLAPTRTPEKINISGVEVNNFLETGTVINDNKDTLFVKNTEYQIIYLPQFNQFIITILSTPFLSVRQKAEEEFLQKTGATQQEACKLDVTIGTTYDVDPTNAGTNFPLSFCN